ncbi:hypothetical protein Ctob_015471 [Chrysochromulina tobinii]|uniref:Uncharacterized protein n=1 Tax=Chrysochromulina tobinii TaxID=1460289 RepID=A0A0M0K4W8_9EUKA|nr:hypothetical protein Ctob_015471 [Chrysochromulina tobinii]|eukprot:KOO33865.1 hypothetical protein Ctob_015471 [Chrysochromulina sp. CCMP291]
MLVRPRLNSTMPICPMKMPKRRGPAFAQEDWAGFPLGGASELSSGERGAVEEDAAAAADAELSCPPADPAEGPGISVGGSTSPPSSEVPGFSRAACTSASQMVMEWRLGWRLRGGSCTFLLRARVSASSAATTGVAAALEDVSPPASSRLAGAMSTTGYIDRCGMGSRMMKSTRKTMAKLRGRMARTAKTTSRRGLISSGESSATAASGRLTMSSWV